MKKKLAIIGGGVMTSYFGEACKKLGYESHYFSMTDGKIDSDKADCFHEINIFDKDKIVDICKTEGINGVVPTTELSIAIAAYVADKLGLIGISPDVAQIITDKYRNRECISNLSTLLSPKFIKASSLEDIKRANLPYPIILKPTSQGGKRGITVVRDESEIEEAFNYAKCFFKPDVTPEIIVEQFLEGGIECSVESLTINGHHTIVQITQKDSSGAPHCVELGHHQPANISNSDWDKVVKGVSDGLTAIGLTEGCCHTEIKLIDGKIYLIEFNARPGGDHIFHPMVMLSTGFDIIAAIAQAAVGDLKEIDVNSFLHNYSGIYYVVKQTEYLAPIFSNCEKESWCVEKNYVTDELIELTHNDMEHTNYMLYASESGDPIAKIIEE